MRRQHLAQEQIHLAALKALVVRKLLNGDFRLFRADPRMTVLGQAMRQMADVRFLWSKQPVARHQSVQKQQADAEHCGGSAVIAQRVFFLQCCAEPFRAFGNRFFAAAFAEPAGVGQEKGDDVGG